MDEITKLRQIIKDAGWSQEELARKLRVPFVTVNRWLNGHSVPRPENRKAIDEVYLGVVGYDVVSLSVLKNTTERALKQRICVYDFYKNPDFFENLVTYMTYHTNVIEGSTMTLADVKEVLSDGDKVLSNRTAREQTEARGHRAALEFLLDRLYMDGEKFVWSEELIMGIHLRLMNTIISDAGVYRRHGVRILGSRTPLANFMTIPEKMVDFVGLLNGNLGDCGLIERMAYTHAMFEQIHPFSDGNGRVGRLIMVAQALLSGVIPPIVLKERKHSYYDCLEEAHGGEYDKLQLFIAESMLDAEVLLNI